MRDFNFQDAPRTTEADIIGEPPLVLDVPLNVRSDESLDQDAALRPFHVQTQGDEPNNTAKIVGGIVVGLLIVGGGLYAYESATRNTQAPQQQVALKAPSSNYLAPDQVPSSTPPTPDNTTTPENMATPAITEPVSPPSARKAVDSAGSNTVTPPPAAMDEATNAPMTATPDTEQPGQMALQQPMTPPDVSSQTTEPAPAIASNETSGVPARPKQETPLAAGQLPADQAQEAAAQ